MRCHLRFESRISSRKHPRARAPIQPKALPGRPEFPISLNTRGKCPKILVCEATSLRLGFIISLALLDLGAWRRLSSRLLDTLSLAPFSPFSLP